MPRRVGAKPRYAFRSPCRRFRQRCVCAGRGHVFAAVGGFACLGVLRAGTMAAGTAPDGDLAVVAELQGMLIEILEKRNAELTAQVADLSERLVRLERAVSRNSLLTEQRSVFSQLNGLTAVSGYTVTGHDRRAGTGPRGTG